MHTYAFNSDELWSRSISAMTFVIVVKFCLKSCKAHGTIFWFQIDCVIEHVSTKNSDIKRGQISARNVLVESTSQLERAKRAKFHLRCQSRSAQNFEMSNQDVKLRLSPKTRCQIGWGLTEIKSNDLTSAPPPLTT